MTNVEIIQNQNILQGNSSKTQPKLLLKYNNNLERTPSADGFVKQTVSDKTLSDSTLKYKVMTAATTLAAAGMGTIAIIKSRKVGKLAKQITENNLKIKTLQTTIDENTKIIDENTKIISKLNEEIDNLSKKLKDALESYATPANEVEELNKYQDEYRKIISSVNNSSDITSAPTLRIQDPLEYINYENRFKLNNLVPYEKAGCENIEALDPVTLKNTLSQNGALEVVVDGPIEKIAGEGMLKEVSLADDFIPQQTSMNMAISVGETINWSNEKIARDMLQNFFDGHGQTLNGVKLKISQTTNGKYRVKIEGKGLFHPEDITLIGGGAKRLDSNNAGGFGEGLKVMICRMISQNQTDNVQIKCANWSTEFAAGANKRGTNVLMQKLSKSSETINGNTIEFETADNALVESILDAMNYFKHSKNPDYQNLSFDSPDFAFKLLNDGQKGNAYFLQRFEVDQKGQWDNVIEAMSIMFKTKPDLEELKKITGYSMEISRDRTKLGFEDIEHLSHYFAYKNMNNEELMRAIISTKHLWNGLKQDDKRIHFAFIKGLLNAAKSKNLGLDLCGEKYVYRTYNLNDIMSSKLKQYGYKILPWDFSKIHIPAADNVFRSLSKHNALPHTELETQKIALLDEAVKIIHNNINRALLKQSKDILPIKLKTPLSGYELDSFLKELDLDRSVLKEIIGDNIASKHYVYWTKEEINLLNSKLTELIKAKLNTHDKTNLAANVRAFISALPYGFFDSLDDLSKNYLTKLKNLSLINAEDITRPKYIFDRNAETATDTLGEAIVNHGKYLGHWIDREYLKNSDFNQMLATWLHEIHHKCGGDGSSEFTYALTDLIEVLLSTHPDNKSMLKLKAIENLYNQLSNLSP